MFTPPRLYLSKVLMKKTRTSTARSKTFVVAAKSQSGGISTIKDSYMSKKCHRRKSVDFSITSSVHSSLPKHLGSIRKRPARFSSSHDMAPIAFLGACFSVDGQKQT